MPPKAKIPAPIDRPLSRAYLREFSGWSTAYPPGLSEPTSLRLMENVWTTREGAVAVRPGLRNLTYVGQGLAPDLEFVGTHEAFYSNEGEKRYLFAVRETDGTVGFRVLVPELLPVSGNIGTLADEGFTIFPDEASLRFSAATTYVKYLQIDNKIFALSNAGETMRMFDVGAVKAARVLTGLDRPEWTVADKLTVVHPDSDWITRGTLNSDRHNLMRPMRINATPWDWKYSADLGRVQSSHVLSAESRPAATFDPLISRINLIHNGLNSPSTHGGETGWSSVGPVSDIHANTNGLRVEGDSSARFTIGAKTEKLPLNQTGLLHGGFSVYNTSANCERVYVEVRWFGANGAEIGYRYGKDWGPAATRRNFDPTAPTDAAYFQVVITGQFTKGTGFINFNRVLVQNGDMPQDGYFDGDSGAGYSWLGTPYESASTFFEPARVTLTSPRITKSSGAKTYSGAVMVYAATAGTSFALIMYAALETGSPLDQQASTFTVTMPGWSRLVVDGFTAPASSTRIWMEVRTNPFTGRAAVGAPIVEEAATVGSFFDGDSVNTSTTTYTWDGEPGSSASREVVYDDAATDPAAATPTADTLISSDPEKNIYNFGFFYMLYNEVGESAASQVTVLRAQRPWLGWRWETPNASAEPSGTSTADPAEVADQLVASLPEEVYDTAVAQGAVGWSLYMMTWSDQDAVPVTAVQIATRAFGSSPSYESDGWLRATPVMSQAGDVITEIPNLENRHNYSIPSSAGQGIVAADRMILVDDPNDAAVIRWSSNEQGHYTDFSASRGGGYKTLTSGNLYVPASVKLWQNPQSTDTLTILCMGTDGHSTGYYMAPAQVAQQSEAVNIMGFEETTATPGTTSPYGCEVLNNALYHPLEDMLMKSTATNYNINHKEQTAQIKNKWVGLLNRHRIVSSQMDNRLYLIVHNPDGEDLLPGCMGNEVWVYDSEPTNGTWSRWLIQACSLRKIEMSGQVVMSVIRPDGIYYFDPSHHLDDHITDDFEVEGRPIPWYIETNTQGANRAHDAWAHVQQANVTFGNMEGTLHYGIRSWDVNGKPVKVEKQMRDLNAPDPLMPWDIDDFLLIRRDLKEWFFYAGSVPDPDAPDQVLPSYGQINLVQYRYTPVSVNVGYEYGSVETFEYGRAEVNWAERTTDNGVPIPAIETRRP